MKIVFIIVFHFLTLIHLIAQEKTRSDFLWLGAGVALPTSHYAAHYSADSVAGYANVGYHVITGGMFSINEIFGLSACFIAGQNDFLENEYIKGREQTFSTILPPDLEYTHSISNYTWTSLLVGPVVRHGYDDSEGFFFLKLMLGRASMRSPKIESEFFYTNTKYKDIIQSARANNFSYLLGSGLQMPINASLDMNFGADFFISTMNFYLAHELQANEKLLSSQAKPYTQKVKMFFLSASLVYKLYK